MNASRNAQTGLADRVIMVTGATRGIGAAVGRALAGRGATVILLGRRTASLEKLYDEIEAAGGPRPAAAPLNLESAQPKEYDHLARQLADEFGRLDGLLHNAAHFSGLTPLVNYRLEDWLHTVQVNLNAAFLLTQACLPLLRRSADASLVFTDDGDAEHAYYGAYGATKSALRGLTRILAAETETNTSIRVNSIDPGPVHTGLRERIQADLAEAALPEPASVVDAYLYLLGPESRGVTGQAFRARDPGPWGTRAGRSG